MGTRMACPDPAGAVETRFLQQLEGVNNLGFLAGQLMLSYEKDGAGGVMLFDGREPSAGE
jgi:heat shock protein HslJ